MLLLQAGSDQGAGAFFIFLNLVLRIVGAVVCSNKAKELNRDTGGWGVFGFIMPIIAMIWVYCMKPKGSPNSNQQGTNQNPSGTGYQGGYDGGHNNPGSGYTNDSVSESKEDYKDGDLYK